MTNPSTTTTRKRSLPAWKIALLVFSLAAVGAGFAIRAMSGSKSAATSSAGAGGSGNALQEGAGASGTGIFIESEPAEQRTDYSPFLIKGGFSFFVGFCIGYALRMFFKVSMLGFGVVFLLLFGLSYFGIVQVDWSALEGHYDRITAHLSSEFKEFDAFIKGSLPAVGLAALGMVIGFKKG